jgi:hypothetical protein
MEGLPGMLAIETTTFLQYTHMFIVILIGEEVSVLANVKVKTEGALVRSLAARSALPTRRPQLSSLDAAAISAIRRRPDKGT